VRDYYLDDEEAMGTSTWISGLMDGSSSLSVIEDTTVNVYRFIQCLRLMDLEHG